MFPAVGSASVELLKQRSQSLAGRISYQTLGGFTSDEIVKKAHSKLWLRGGFPRSYLAASEAASLNWRKNFIGTFLERDIPQ